MHVMFNLANISTKFTKRLHVNNKTWIVLNLDISNTVSNGQQTPVTSAYQIQIQIFIDVLTA